MRYCTIIAVLAAGWVAYAPGGPKWQKLGPGGGGALFYPTISPHNTSTLLVGCDMTGSYISGDTGESWRMFNLRSRAAFFAFDPVNPGVMYAGARGLFQSADGGQTWNLIFPEPAKVRGISMPDDHAGAVMVTKDGTAPRERLTLEFANSVRRGSSSTCRVREMGLGGTNAGLVFAN